MGKFGRKPIFFLLGIFLGACASNIDYSEVVIPDGAFVMVNEAPMRVSEDMILEIVGFADERCPVGVICSEPGEIHVRFKAYVDNEYVEQEISFNNIYKSNCLDTICGHVIQILDVNPIPFPDEEINPNKYQVELQLVR